MKKKHPEHVNLERWLVSYADFITLLFAFFVVMYSIANQDKAKIKQITESIEKSFFGPSSQLDKGTGDRLNIFSHLQSVYGMMIDQPMGHTNAAPIEESELKSILDRIEESLSYQMQTTDLKDSLQMIYDEQRGFIVRFSANKLFEPGREDVRLQYLPVIDKITKAIAPTSRLIRVEGYTDSQPPPESGKFPTNWELSTARASWVVRYMKAKWNIPTRRLSAVGYADGYPIASNEAEAGRERNNRLEIVVTNLRDATNRKNPSQPHK